MQHSIRCLSITTLVVIGLIVPVTAQKKHKKPRPPVLIRNTAAVVAPGMSIELEAFYPDGIPDVTIQTRFIFLQEGKSLTARPAGGVGALEKRTQTFNVTAPEGLKSGACEVVLYAGWQQSQPLRLEVSDSVPPPVVTSDYAQVTSVPQQRPRPAQPGDRAYFEGANFSPTDEVEIVDARGVVHRVPATSSSSAASSGFDVPENIADGEATFEVVEQRSGRQQRSKKIPIQILNVPLPLEIPLNGMRPVAPGQWLDITTESAPPYGQPKDVEIAFIQGEKTAVVEVRLEENTDLHLQVPTTLAPGDTVVKTRTRRIGGVSAWSNPARLQLLEHPAPPLVDSIQRLKASDFDRSEPLVHFEGKSRVLNAAPGDRIAVWGHFGIESTRSLEIRLINDTRQAITKPLENEPSAPCYFEFEIPRDLANGDWQIDISERINDTSARLLLTLKVRRSR